MINSPYLTEFADDFERQADAELWAEAVHEWGRRVGERRRRIAGAARLAAAGSATFPIEGEQLVTRYDEVGRLRAQLEGKPVNRRTVQDEDAITRARQEFHELEQRCRRSGLIPKKEIPFIGHECEGLLQVTKLSLATIRNKPGAALNAGETEALVRMPFEIHELERRCRWFGINVEEAA
jgi:hypothetical protein